MFYEKAGSERPVATSLFYYSTTIDNYLYLAVITIERMECRRKTL